MTLIKSILLGSAAGIVAAAAAQAADLPTKKAAPAEYVKICNVGGMAGWLLPGSDTCFKISGYVTSQVEAGNLQQGYEWGFAPGLSPGAPPNSPAGTAVTLQKPTVFSPTTPGFKPGAASVVFGAPSVARNLFGWTARLNLTVDARQDTAYGVLRGYAEAQFENGNGFDNTGPGGYINRMGRDHRRQGKLVLLVLRRRHGLGEHLLARPARLQSARRAGLHRHVWRRLLRNLGFAEPRLQRL
jgi:hypothetical protein